MGQTESLKEKEFTYKTKLLLAELIKEVKQTTCLSLETEIEKERNRVLNEIK